MSNTPTVVLIHGAFADASSFGRIIPTLLDEGIKVLAPAVPNRSLAGDAAYVASLVSQIDGPVLLVGHSYGGAVITVAGTEDNVVGLVYLAGTPWTRVRASASSRTATPPRPWPTPSSTPRSRRRGHGAGGRRVRGPGRFPAIFAADVDTDLTRVLAVSQRPLAAAAFGEPAGLPAWRTKPAWGIVASADQAINPDVERFGYERAQMKVVEVDSSHLVMHARPAEVVGVIREALASVTS